MLIANVPQELNPKINAVISSTVNEAEIHAQMEKIRGGGASGILAGVGVLVKDSINVRGLPTTSGSEVVLAFAATGFRV